MLQVLRGLRLSKARCGALARFARDVGRGTRAPVVQQEPSLARVESSVAAAESTVTGGVRVLQRNAKVSVGVQTKVRAITLYEATRDARGTIATTFPFLSDRKQFNKRAQLYKWVADKDRLMAAQDSGGAAKKKLRGLGHGTVLPPEAELDLVKWINDLQKEGVPVSSTLLALRANEPAQEYSVSQFSASWCWVQSFKRRHHLALRARTRQGQQSPADLEQLRAAFAEKINILVREQGIKKIYNADQTAVFFEYLPKRTLTKRGEKTACVRCGGKDKERATVMLLADSNGDKLAPFVVFKNAKASTPEKQLDNDTKQNGFGHFVWKEVCRIQETTSMHVYGNPKAWWNSRLSKRFLETHFATDRNSQSEPILLIWDDFSGHWTPEVQEYAKSINIMLERVPAHATSVAHPADVAWIKPFKDKLRSIWIEHLRKQVESITSGKKFVPPRRVDVTLWVKDAWSSVNIYSIRNGYRRSGFCPTSVRPVEASLMDAVEELTLVDSTFAARMTISRTAVLNEYHVSVMRLISL